MTPTSCEPEVAMSRRRMVALASALGVVGMWVGVAQPTHASLPPDTLYGVTAAENTRPGIVTIDQSDASTVPLPILAGYFQDLAFDSSGRLFATTTCLNSDASSCALTGPSVLVELDPV